MRFGRRPKGEPEETDEDSTPLARTWFGSEEAWESLLRSVRTPSDDGFLASVQVINGRARLDATPSALAALLSGWDEYSIVIAADEHAMSEPRKPLLVVLADGSDQPQTMRVLCSELWGIENNLRLANVEWEAFADAAAGDGIFRAFAH